MAFNRDNAVNYADRHWNIPCDDGVFWLSNEAVSIEQKRRELKAPAADGWAPMFVAGVGEPEKAVFRRTVGGVVEEKLINGWAGLADCAHFLSSCLTAGGVSIHELGVPTLVAKLQARSDTKTLCERVPRDRGQQVIDTGILKRGDMIGYFNVDPAGDYGGAQAYSHSTMYVGKLDTAHVGGVTCHTVARFPPRSWVNDSWWLHAGYVYTLIHFSDDDTPPNAIAPVLQGWWKLDYAGRSEYYFISPGGTAHYTKRAPKTARDFIQVVEGSAYWFNDGGPNVTFIWRKTGTVEVWSRGAAPGQFRSMINSTTPGVVSRLF